jgi:transketolase
MALAPLVYTLWNRVLRFDTQDPIWPNRDRFVLSNGHASMLLWSVLHLARTQAVNADYERLAHPSVSLEDIRTGLNTCERKCCQEDPRPAPKPNAHSQ